MMNEKLDGLKRSLCEHTLYQLIKSSGDLRCFMERHVFCVWDFMWLLKSLQRDLTCVSVPWMPPSNPEAARFINEIVLGEESDEISQGTHGSHFEWYMLAMEEVGCDLRPVLKLLSELRSGTPVLEALQASSMPSEARRFVHATVGFLDAPLHIRGAVFFHSREDIIPRMFVRVVEKLEETGLYCKSLVAYLRRHIEVDSDAHGPLAERLLGSLYADNYGWQVEAEQAAMSALRARRDLWDATLRKLVG